MRLPRPLIVAVGVVLLLTGCAARPAPSSTSAPSTTASGSGSSADQPTPAGSTDPSGDGAASTDDASGDPSPSSSDADGAGQDGEVDPTVYTTEDGRLTHLDFDSPDRNLHCGIWDTEDDDSFYGCVIDHRSYREPTPGECQQSFGNGFVAPFAGRPHAACRGGVLFDGETRQVPILPSGATLSHGAIECSVAGDAVTCGNQRGDGFTLSAAGYTLRG